MTMIIYLQLGFHPVAVNTIYNIATKFTSGGLHEKHVVATWNHLSICLKTQGNQEKPVPRWPIAGPSGY
jgi:hypothetical protein